MKKVTFKILIKSKVDKRNNQEVLLQVDYEKIDSAYIEALGPSYYRIHAPKTFRIISPENHKELVDIEKTRKHNELTVMRIGFGRSDNMDNIKIEVVDITEVWKNGVIFGSFSFRFFLEIECRGR